MRQIANSYVEYTVSELGTTMEISFPYISSNDIHVYGIDSNGLTVEITTGWTLTDTDTITIDTPANFTPYVYAQVRRETHITSKLVDFQDATLLSSSDLNLITTQLYYLIQEIDEDISTHCDYVTNSDMCETLDDYVTLVHLNNTLADYVTSTALGVTLGSYVTSASLGVTLGDYVTSISLSTTLADYATKVYVTDAIAAIDYTGFASETYVTDAIAAIDFSPYVTTTALGVTLGDYVTTTALGVTLGDYVTTTALGVTLGDYVTTTALGTTLASYATIAYVDAQISALGAGEPNDDWKLFILMGV